MLLRNAELGHGITAVTDATPDLDEAAIEATERAMSSGVLPPRVYLLGVPLGRTLPGDRVQPGDDCASALLNYVLGLAGQYVHQVATQLPGHDDREQFLAGIDLILAGITTVR